MILGVMVALGLSPSLTLRMGCGLWVGGRWRAREAVIVSVCDLSSSPQHRGPGPPTGPALEPGDFRFLKKYSQTTEGRCLVSWALLTAGVENGIASGK